MPTPASQPDEQRLPSPVARYSVSCLRSVGSSTSCPTEFCSRSSGATCFHSGSGVTALSVRQTPPPAVPAQRRHLRAEQSGSATSATVRLAVLFVAPLKAMTPGSVEYRLGPNCCHFLSWAWKLRPSRLASRASRLAIRLNVTSARLTIDGGIALAGYVRAAARYASKPPARPSPAAASLLCTPTPPAPSWKLAWLPLPDERPASSTSANASAPASRKNVAVSTLVRVRVIDSPLT